MLVADGAMGSVLFEAAGVQRCFEELNISQPEAVFRVHQAYIQAGRADYRDEYVRRQPLEAGGAGPRPTRWRRSIIAA